MTRPSRQKLSQPARASFFEWVFLMDSCVYSSEVSQYVHAYQTNPSAIAEPRPRGIYIGSKVRSACARLMRSGTAEGSGLASATAPNCGSSSHFAARDDTSILFMFSRVALAHCYHTNFLAPRWVGGYSSDGMAWFAGYGKLRDATSNEYAMSKHAAAFILPMSSSITPAPHAPRLRAGLPRQASPISLFCNHNQHLSVFTNMQVYLR
jgi:hypothetical protein